MTDSAGVPDKYPQILWLHPKMDQLDPLRDILPGLLYPPEWNSYLDVQPNSGP